GHAEAVRVLAEAGAGLASTNSLAFSPLHAAANHGHAEAVRVLLVAGADPNAKFMNYTPLDMAFNKKYTNVIEAMIHGGIDPNAENMRQLTPLMRAIANLDADALRSLLAAGADPNWKVGADSPDPFSHQALPEGATALHLAACLGEPEFITALLDAGTDSQSRDVLDFTPLMLATASGHAEAARLLHQATPPSEADAATIRAFELVAAVRAGDEERVRALLDSGVPADVNVPNTFKYHYYLRCEPFRSEFKDDFAFFDASTETGEGTFNDADRPVLSLALELGHEAIVDALIASGAGVKTEPKSRQFKAPSITLIDAARHGRRSAVASLLAAGADANVKDRDGYTPLMHAAQEGNADIVSDLIAAGAKVNVKSTEKSTPISLAVGHADVLRVLLKAGAKVKPYDLTLAVVNGNLESIRLLIDAIRARKLTPDAETLSMAIWSDSGSIDIVRLLLDAGLDVNARDGSGRPVLVAACWKSIELARLLLDSGADVNARGENGISALSASMMGRPTTLAQLLLERGADIENRMDGNVKGETPLIRAAGFVHDALVTGLLKDPEKLAVVQANDDKMIRLLLEHGANLEARDLEQGRTALIHAAANGREHAVRLLIDAGADLNAQDERNGRTALMCTAIEGHANVVRCLIEAGANPNTEDLDGKTAAGLGKGEIASFLRAFETGPSRFEGSPTQALRKASEAGDAEAIRRAVRAGADVNARLSGGLSALMVATGSGSVEAVQALLDAGANPNVHDPEGKTPLIVAIQKGSPALVKTLLDAGADPDGTGSKYEGGDPETPLCVAIGERCNVSGNAWGDVVNGFKYQYLLGDEHVEIVRALIAAGASIDAMDERGNRPLWYAFDTGQDELAELLIEAGAGGDPISAAYLNAKDFPNRAKGEEFQELVRKMAGLCDAEPKPLTTMPTHKDFQTLHRDGPFPTGPTIGAAFNVPRERADELIHAYQEELRRAGAFLVITERYTGNFDFNRQVLGLVPTDDTFTVIAALCGAGTDWDWVCPAFTIRDLRAIEPDYPFRLIGCERRSLELEFATPIADVTDLATRLNAIRTTLCAPGMPEGPDLEDVIESLRRSPRIQFGWE
ncbi:MAG: ankyrin repeat domain-containing protein, partial [Isosphaeraceae bacterium]